MGKKWYKGLLLYLDVWVETLSEHLFLFLWLGTGQGGGREWLLSRWLVFWFWLDHGDWLDISDVWLVGEVTAAASGGNWSRWLSVLLWWLGEAWD